ncbi:MAG: DNA primase [Balneola sp.]|jgi:DNA primase|nr:DNA primase [Balneola sp.]MBF65497.1 DNA primase [Balneola sp.]|tara:strand:+ start:3884 stop:5899 length:2016 start_codon:yes stop_codon:yes gene_type:complete
MITDDKKEEVRDAADIVEVVGDYVKLKRSGSGFTGLCPYHDEKTPSFNVTPRLGIYKCFGCGESGDVFKFVMDQDGIGFTEAVRQLADRYGVFIPEEESNEPSESLQQKEGIYHALKFAGIYFYRNLIENPDAEKALKYLDNRGYNREVFKKYGLGYAPTGGSDLYKAAQNAGISEEYLVEADLIKPSQRGEGYYDTFRGRLMFPIFGTTGKVIAFAGRVLGNEKTAKYINSAQTKVYNKSEVVYGVNFAKNEIRKNKEVILVEGYTDVITLNEHGIKNVVASSGTALTPGQMKILNRYGEKIIMIYDADNAGQAAMKRGIDIALAQGMEVQLLELPDGEDPDSFVKQFGKESFDELKSKEALDFVDFLLLKADEEGRLKNPVQVGKVISEILQAIASIKESIQRQIYVQHLHQKTQQYRKGSDRELFTELERVMAQKMQEDSRDRRREELRDSRLEQEQNDGDPGIEGAVGNLQTKTTRNTSPAKKPSSEKELIRLMITYGRDMVEYICSFTNEKLFEDEELKMFYVDILGRYKEEKEISIQVYSAKQEPFPRLVGDVLLEQYSPSERHQEKVGLKYEKDKNPYRTAKSTMKAMELAFFKRKLAELSERFGRSDSQDEKKKIMTSQTKIQEKVTKLTTTYSDDYYPDPPQESDNVVNEKKFEYKMKSDRN